MTCWGNLLSSMEGEIFSVKPNISSVTQSVCIWASVRAAAAPLQCGWRTDGRLRWLVSLFSSVAEEPTTVTRQWPGTKPHPPTTTTKGPLHSHYQRLSMTPALNITKLCCHIDTSVCFANTQSHGYCHRSNVMTLSLASPTDSHTLGQWQWTKLSPVFLRVIGELTFGLRGKQAHDRLVCGPPPGFHLCDP